MASAAPSRRCVMCTAIASNTCNGCDAARYCSRKCQKIDWPVHKILCRAFRASFANEKRPSPQHIRAIYFPEHEDQPRLVWLHAMEMDGDYRVSFSVLKNATDFRIETWITDSAFLKEPLHKVILTGCRMTDSGCGKPVAYGMMNTSFRKIDEGMDRIMIGPLLAYGSERVNDKPGKPIDLDLGDFRHIFDHFSLRCERGKRKINDLFTENIVSGVRVNCDADHFITEWPEYEATHLAENVFFQYSCPDIIHPAPKKLEIPLAIIKYKPSRSWHNREINGLPANCNWAYRWLASNMFKIPNASNTQEYPVGVVANGSIFVTRVDRKPLHPEHLKAMVFYLSTIADKFGQDDGKDMGEYLELLSKADFAEYWDNWKKKFPGLEKVQSPYN